MYAQIDGEKPDPAAIRRLWKKRGQDQGVAEKSARRSPDQDDVTFARRDRNGRSAFFIRGRVRYTISLYAYNLALGTPDCEIGGGD